jgi:hypothetical protein
MYLWEQELRDDATIIIENHWLINYIDTKAKSRFAAGVYQSL